MREFSRALLESSAARDEAQRAVEHRYAFVGNLANNLYMRAVPLRKRGLDIEIVMHPSDTFVMSQPGWEEFDRSLPAGIWTTAELAEAGIQLPEVSDVVTPSALTKLPLQINNTGQAASFAGVRDLMKEKSYLRASDIVRFPGQLTFLPLIDHLQSKDALLATQAPYLAYLARRPYLVAQGGGDLWFECSRDDQLGQIQRLAFGSANAILASNPWTFAHARRFGFRNAIYLPFILDEDAYSPGPGRCRREWEQATSGGSFFVLSTSRLDDAYKGSRLALEGFFRFHRDHPEARLVLIGWGEHEEEGLDLIREWGLERSVLRLPVAGKRRIVEYLRSADCLLDQFSLGAYGATALEAMACALPVVMRLELTQYEALCALGAPPVLNASSAEEIAARLSLLASDPDLRRRAGEAHRSWFVANHGSSAWAPVYEALLRTTALGRRFRFEASPLSEPLGEEEIEYHRAGLALAPPFPEYSLPPWPPAAGRAAATGSRKKDGLTTELAWLREFKKSRGRSLRVLHVGNIANNAYLNAKFLREIGIECHVLCFDYYDGFATPEWEGGNGVRRPRWFVQGPFRRCAAYLDAALSERRWQRWFRWHRLSLARAFQTRLTTGRTLPSIRFWSVVARYKLSFARSWLWSAPYKLSFARSWLWSLTRFLTRRTLRLVGFNIKEPAAPELDEPGAPERDEPAELEVNASPERQRLVKRFVEAFPARRDSLSLADFAAWDRAPDVWRGLFERYDIVQCYATEPIRALLAAKRPYVAYEHGTLRDFTMGDDPTHRLNALAYRDSDHVFITNGDCLSFAEALGIPRFSPMVHPVDIDQHERDLGEEPRRLRDSLGADVLLLCPLRHDWAIKGTDIHIRALPRIVEENAGRVVMVLTTWGAQVDESARLISELGCGRYVKWLPPLDRLGLITHMKAADVLLDQMVLPHFGATAPQGLAAGVPVIMSYRPESTEWIVDEPAPILAAFDPDGVAEAVRTALDPAWRREFALRAHEWVHRYHHPNRVVIEHCRVYRQLLER